MSKTMSKFEAKFTKETYGLKDYSFKPEDQDKLKVGQYIKFMYGIEEQNLTRMVGKINRIGYSEKYHCKYFETITDYGFYTTTVDKIYKVYLPKIKERIKANRSATCIALNTAHSEELPYMISTLDKMKNYIERKNIGKIVSNNIIDTNRTYNYNLTINYPSGKIVSYIIPDRNANNILFQMKGHKKPFTFKVRNREGKIDLNFEKVKRMIKRFI